MPRTGRPRKPTALKLLEGNPGKRAINNDEPKLPSAESAAPKGLAGRALAVWNGLASDMTTAGMLKSGDTHTLRVFCEVVADTEKFTALCRKVGPENSVKLGYVKRLDMLRKQLREFSGILGLNPSSRSAIKVTPAEPKNDPAADFIFGGKKIG